MEASLSSHYQYHRMQADRERCYSDNHHVSQFEAAAAAAAASAAATASLFDQHLSAMANSSAVVDDGLYRTFPIVFDRLPYMEIARAMAATARGVTYDAHAKAPAFGLHPTEDRHSKKNDQVAVASTSLPMPTGSRKYQRRSSVCASAVPASEHSGNSGNRERNCYEPKHQLTVDDVLASIRSGLAFTQDHLDAVLYGRRSGTYDQQELGRNGCQESTATSSMNLFEQHATISPSSPSVTKRTGSLSYGIDRLLQRNESNPSSQPQPPMTSSLTSRRLHRASLKTSPSTADLPEGLEIRRVWRGGNVHYGVYSIRSSIPRGTRFGPYRGRIVNPSEIKANDDNTFMWEVFVNGSLSHFVDGRGPAGSWMSYVNCARYPHEQNLVAVQTSKRVKTHSSITKSPPAHKYFSSTQLSPVFSKRKACEKICHDIESSDTAETSVSQFEGMGFDSAHGAEIYYETCQDIPFGAELLVWYGDCYEQFLGVPVALRSDGGNMPPVVNAAKSSSIQPTPSSPRLSPMLKAAEYPTQLALSPPHQKVSSSSEDAVNVAGGRSVRGDRSESTRHATDDASDGYQCSRCGKVFAYKYYRDKHLKYTRCVDQGDRKFPCHLCSRSFEKRDRLRIHVLHVHEKHRPHKCMLCSKSFSQSSSLNKHMRVHSGERPYKCVYCSKAFTASSILRTHIRQHSGEKPFKCKFCGKAFASHAAHDSHARRTHGTPPFAGASGDSTACGRCGRTFENSRELKIHDCTSPAPAAAADTIGFLGRFNKNSMKILDAYGSSSSFQRDSLQVSNEDEQIDVVGLEMNDDVIRA